MTVPNIVPVNNYSGNGSITTFDFDFLIEDSSELVVTHTNSDGLQKTLELNTDYTINEIGNKNGSYIIFPKAGSSYSALKSDEKITLALSLDIEQDAEYPNSEKLVMTNLEHSFDYLTRIAQIQSRELSRAIKVQEGVDIDADNLVKSILTVAENIGNIEAATQSIKTGMKFVSVSSSDWVEYNGVYTCTISDLPIALAVFEGSLTDKNLVTGVNIEVTTSGITLTSPAPIDGYVLGTKAVEVMSEDEELELLDTIHSFEVFELGV